MEFRKTETQNKKLCVSRDNLVPLIREIGLKYKELNRKPAVDIRLVVEKEHMPIYFDKEIIQTILDNLISNALKYTVSSRRHYPIYSTVITRKAANTRLRVPVSDFLW